MLVTPLTGTCGGIAKGTGKGTGKGKGAAGQEFQVGILLQNDDELAVRSFFLDEYDDLIREAVASCCCKSQDEDEDITETSTEDETETGYEDDYDEDLGSLSGDSYIPSGGWLKDGDDVGIDCDSPELSMRTVRFATADTTHEIVAFRKGWYTRSDFRRFRRHTSRAKKAARAEIGKHVHAVVTACSASSEQTRSVLPSAIAVAASKFRGAELTHNPGKAAIVKRIVQRYNALCSGGLWTVDERAAALGDFSRTETKPARRLAHVWGWGDAVAVAAAQQETQTCEADDSASMTSTISTSPTYTKTRILEMVEI